VVDEVVCHQVVEHVEVTAVDRVEYRERSRKCWIRHEGS
jgi:hypothetical protein